MASAPSTKYCRGLFYRLGLYQSDQFVTNSSEHNELVNLAIGQTVGTTPLGKVYFSKDASRQSEPKSLYDIMEQYPVCFDVAPGNGLPLEGGTINVSNTNKNGGHETKIDAAFISLQERPDVHDLIEFARKTSPYYSSLYANTSKNVSFLHDYPVVDHGPFWAANTPLNSQVITMPQSSGIIWKTGGTLGNPKVTFISQDELRSISIQLGRAIIEAGLLPTDRIANLFYAGDLYGSFLVHVLSIQDLSLPAIHIPIAGSCDAETTIHHMKELDATVIFSTVTKVTQLAQLLLSRNETMDRIRVFMFAGEPFFDDQKTLIKAAFPQARVRSLVYASMDAGVMGHSVSDSDWRLHQVNRPFVELEICADGDDCLPISEPNVSGRVLVTNFGRRLQPVIRYPCGDRAEWVDYEKGLFRVLGRDTVSARIGPVSLDTAHVRSIIDQIFPNAPIAGIQLILDRVDSMDSLTIRIAYHPPDPVGATNAIVAKLKEERPMFQQHVDDKLIAPLRVEFVDAEDLTINVRTGKLMGLVDQRLAN